MFYVYRFLDKNEKIIYIGKTGDMDSRIRNHIDSGHLPLSCYKTIEKIEYIEVPTKVDMDILELYLINKFKPFFNRLDKEKSELYTNITNDLQWKPYSKVDYKLLLKYKNQLKETQTENKSLQKKYYRLMGTGDIASLDTDKVGEPYYLKNLNSKLSYVAEALDKKVVPVKNSTILYNYKEVIHLLKANAQLKFKCMNEDLEILVYRQKELIIFEEKDCNISECKVSKYVINLLGERHSDIGSFNLAGVVPYLHYTVDR